MVVLVVVVVVAVVVMTMMISQKDVCEVTGERSAEDQADELLLQQERFVPVRGEVPIC